VFLYLIPHPISSLSTWKWRAISVKEASGTVRAKWAPMREVKSWHSHTASSVAAIT
jgi:hypothetical protein